MLGVWVNIDYVWVSKSVTPKEFTAMKKVTVFGGGATGYVVSAELSVRGFDVCLCEESDYADSLDAARQHGEIAISGPGIDGVGKIGLITTDLQVAMDWADQVIICAISNRDEHIARMLAPHLHIGQSILLSAGNFGSFLFRKVFDEEKAADVIVGETCGNLFPSRIVGEAKTVTGFPWSPKPAAAWPTKDTDALIEAFADIYELSKAPSILCCALDVGNMMSHIAPVLLNAGAIENCKGSYYIFRQGISPAVIHVVDALWDEKKNVMDALGYPASPSLSGLFSPLMDDSFHGLDDFKNLEGPNTVTGRHIIEDTPTLDCLMISVAAAMGVDVPLFRAMVKVVSAMNQTDYYAQGRTLENLGLGHLKGQDLVAYFA